MPYQPKVPMKACKTEKLKNQNLEMTLLDPLTQCLAGMKCSNNLSQQTVIKLPATAKLLPRCLNTTARDDFVNFFTRFLREKHAFSKSASESACETEGPDVDKSQCENLPHTESQNCGMDKRIGKWHVTRFEGHNTKKDFSCVIELTAFA